MEADSETRSEGEAEGETEAGKVWQAALAVLRTLVDPRVYERRLAGSSALTWDREKNHWTIGIRDELSVDWVSHRLSKPVTTALSRHTLDLPPPELEFVTCPPGAEPEPSRRPGQARLGAGSAPVGTCPRTEHRDRPTNRAEPSRRREVRQKPEREFGPMWYYSRILRPFHRQALRRLKGVKLSVFIYVALHAGRDHVAAISLEQIMGGTGYCRAAVCSALKELCSPRFRLLERLPRSQRGPSRFRVLGYIYFGSDRVPAIYELEEEVEFNS